MPRTVANFQWAATSYSNVQDHTEANGMAFSGLLDCIDELNLNIWYFQLSGVPVTFVADQSAYAAPTDYKSAKNFTYKNSSNNIAGQFDPVTHKEFEVRQAQHASTTIPKYYTVKTPYPSGVIMLSEATDASFVSDFPTGEFTYYARVPYPTSTTDVISVPPEIEQWLLWTLRTQLAVTYAIEKAKFSQEKADRFWIQARINHRDDEDQDWR